MTPPTNQIDEKLDEWGSRLFNVSTETLPQPRRSTRILLGSAKPVRTDSGLSTSQTRATYVRQKLQAMVRLARLVTSAYELEEAKRNLSSGQQRAELERLCHAVEVVSVLPPQGEIPILAKLPENDRPILWAAISVRATHLLSGDFKAFGRF